jgi:hypothetical protein
MMMAESSLSKIETPENIMSVIKKRKMRILSCCPKLS